ncbi:BNR repeat domain protein [Labilithrix luteola]|uniref:BNR repeat domain protein n=1 Tax=Labilithrix luteola TaxID=1391654 RepID=A0A0K1QDL2_9BACT|nr:hypothetical protein [Labilithrix luteola]AKV03808.1 BNR repeat domain protein [Labilithrix luteola]
MRRHLGTVVVLVGLTACGVDGVVLRDGPDGSVTPTTDGGGSVLADGGASGPFAIQASQDYSCALVAGRAYCWGRNDTGALGTGDTIVRLAPSSVASGVIFEALALGANHTCGLERDTGHVLCWGNGMHGQLGQGRTVNELTPVPVNLPGRVKVVTAGYDHTCAIIEPGALYCWGSNAEGQLGQNDDIDAPDALSPIRVGTDNDWIAVSGGQGHTCGIRTAGTYCWGRNAHDELGVGTGQPAQIRVPSLVAGDYVTVEGGQDSAIAIGRDGTVHEWGDDDTHLWSGSARLSTPGQTPGLASAREVSTDTFSSCALTNGGHVSCWGRNIEGQLGLGDIDDHTFPTEMPSQGIPFSHVSVGRFHTCVMTEDGRFGCVGKNDMGQLGTGDTDRRNTVTLMTISISFH